MSWEYSTKCKVRDFVGGSTLLCQAGAGLSGVFLKTSAHELLRFAVHEWKEVFLPCIISVLSSNQISDICKSSRKHISKEVYVSLPFRASLIASWKVRPEDS